VVVCECKIWIQRYGLAEVVDRCWLLQNSQQESNSVFRFGGCRFRVGSFPKRIQRILFMALADELFGAVNPLTGSIALYGRTEKPSGDTDANKPQSLAIIGNGKKSDGANHVIGAESLGHGEQLVGQIGPVFRQKRNDREQAFLKVPVRVDKID